MNKNLEIRSFVSEIRALEEGSRKISGLAIPVGSRSELLFGEYNHRKLEFYETIEPEALDGIIENFDVKLYINHDMTQGTFARSKYGVGSLHLMITERGLEFETEAPNTAFGDMLLEGIRRGDFDAMSFAFKTDDESWRPNEDGTYDRTIKHISLLDEISILSLAPAYTATDVAFRSLENYIKEEELKKKDLLNGLDAKIAELNEAAKI